jgi:hypothetical protein
LTTFSLLKTLRVVCLFICLGLLSACATPTKPSSTDNVSFGKQPTDYQNIVKTYLQNKPTKTPLNIQNIEFLNEPNKFIYETFRQEKFGYRVCTLINTDNNNGLRAHFFLINDGRIIQHSQDLGLLALSKKICDVDMLTSNNRAVNAAIVPAVVAEVVDENGFKYISCQANSSQLFFAFNKETGQLLEQHDGKQVAVMDIEEITETYIIATSVERRISINRISGMLLDRTSDTESQAVCELSSQQRF